MELLADIQRFLQRSGMPPTSFGRDALGDPRFVFDLRKGRQPGAKVSARAYAFIADHEGRRGMLG